MGIASRMQARGGRMGGQKVPPAFLFGSGFFVVWGAVCEGN
jgi:hypothetical protein